MATSTLSHAEFMELLSKAIKKKRLEVTKADGSQKVYTRYVEGDREAFDALRDHVAFCIDGKYQYKENATYAIKFIYRLAISIFKGYRIDDYIDLLSNYISEISLVNDIKNPDQKAYRLLYAKYINRIRVFYNGKTRNVQDGRDLADIAFALAYEKIDKYDPQYGFQQFVTHYLGKSILNIYWKEGLTTILNAQLLPPVPEDGMEWEDIPQPPIPGDPLARKEIAIILMRLIFLCGKPHAVISFVFKKLFDLESKDFVDKSIGSIVDDLAQEACSSCHEFIDPFMPDDFYYNNISKFVLLKIDMKVKEIYKQERYKDWWTHRIKHILYDVFYTPDKERHNQVDDWNYKLATRIKEHIEEAERSGEHAKKKNVKPCEDDPINKNILGTGGKVTEMKHIDWETIGSYGKKRMTEQEMAAVDEHLARCQECVNRVWAHEYVQDHFDQVWEDFSSGRLFKELRADRRIAAADGEPLELELIARARALVTDLKGRAAAVLKIALNVRRKTAQVLDEGLELLGLDRAALSFAPVAAPVRVRGEEPIWTVAFQAQGPPRVQVMADPVTQRISIQIWLIEPPWPLAVLHSTATDERLVAEFQHPEGADYLLAEFDELPSGEFSLTWERSGLHERHDP